MAFFAVFAFQTYAVVQVIVMADYGEYALTFVRFSVTLFSIADKHHLECSSVVE